MLKLTKQLLGLTKNSILEEDIGPWILIVTEFFGFESIKIDLPKGAELIIFPNLQLLSINLGHQMTWHNVLNNLSAALLTVFYM